MEVTRLLSALWCLAGCLGQGSQFRSELFPEQLQQQQIQFQQIGLQKQMQDLQLQLQDAAGTPRMDQLLRQQSDLFRKLQEKQLQQLDLQELLQDRLGGGVSYRRPEVNDFESLNRIVNKVNIQQTQTQSPEQLFRPHPSQELLRPQSKPPQQNLPPQTSQQPFRPQPPLQPPQQTFPPLVQGPQTPQQSFRPQPQPQAPQQSFTPEVQVPQQPSQQAIRQQAATGAGSRCVTKTGESGSCQPLVSCLSFYADLPHLKSQPCPLGQALGVCCPHKTALVGQPNIVNSGVLVPLPPPPVAIPPLTSQQLDNAAANALQRLQDRLSFIAALFANHIALVPGSAADRHQEFFPTTNATLQRGEQAQQNVEASVGLVNEFNLSPDQGTFALPTFSILNTVIGDSCPRESTCLLSKYRTADGSCNNLQHGHWGQTATALQRILAPKYGDGVNSPRTHSATGQELPSARLVSTQFAQEFDAPSDNYTLMVMQWGQFLDHDLTHTPISKGGNGNGISCCRDGVDIEPSLRHPDCFAIPLPRSDHIFAPFGERCMEFVRSLPAPRPECNFGPREQMNQVTGYLDGSNIYGSRENVQSSLREFRNGRLRIQNVGGRQMLPSNADECADEMQRLSCFRAGDGRVNEQVELALMHTLWMREHNRVAEALTRLNPTWSDEATFQEARRVIIAEMEHITYNEFLPIVLGRAYMDKFSLSPRDQGWTQLYNDQLNGGITNVFATAAFRFGHSLIQSHLHGYGMFGNIRQDLVLSQQHFNPFVLYKDGVVDDFVRGLSTQSCQKFDRFFTKEVTDHLFQGDLDFGLDLVALNIQRGRDHGLPPYNDWRNICGIRRARSWSDLRDTMDQQSIARLQSLYGSVDEVDLFVGAVAERPLQGAVLGPTFACLVGDQFARLRRADRFFYEESNQPSTFTQHQLEQLRYASLSRIMCDNADSIEIMQPLAFVQPSYLNQRVSCRSQAIPVVNLRAWAGETPAVN